MMLEAFGFIFLILLCFVAVLADFLIIYTLLRFKKLRNPFNTFLANWAIADLCSIILIPISALFTFAHRGSGKFLLTLVQAALIIHVTEILFGIVLCLDWCLAAYYQRTYEKFTSKYRYIIAFIWILTLIFYVIVSSLSAIYFDLALTMILFGIFYSISLIFMITLQLSRIVQKFKTFPISYPQPLPMRLTLITIILLSYFFVGLSMLLVFLDSFYGMRDYAMATVIVSVGAVLSGSIVTLILLCWLNHDFRQCLFQLKTTVQQEQFYNDVSEVEDNKINPDIIVPPSTEEIVTNVHADLV